MKDTKDVLSTLLRTMDGINTAINLVNEEASVEELSIYLASLRDVPFDMYSRLSVNAGVAA